MRFTLATADGQARFPREVLFVFAWALPMVPTREPLAPLSRGKGRIEHTLEPRGMWALEVQLAESLKTGRIAPK